MKSFNLKQRIKGKQQIDRWGEGNFKRNAAQSVHTHQSTVFFFLKEGRNDGRERERENVNCKDFEDLSILKLIHSFNCFGDKLIRFQYFFEVHHSRVLTCNRCLVHQESQTLRESGGGQLTKRKKIGRQFTKDSLPLSFVFYFIFSYISHIL